MRKRKREWRGSRGGTRGLYLKAVKNAKKSNERNQQKNEKAQKESTSILIYREKKEDSKAGGAKPKRVLKGNERGFCETM